MEVKVTFLIVTHICGFVMFCSRQAVRVSCARQKVWAQQAAAAHSHPLSLRWRLSNLNLTLLHSYNLARRRRYFTVM